jgi:hypothetical protein
MRAIKYLFEGSYGEDLFKGVFSEDSLDDIIVLIQESKLSVFWGNQAREKYGTTLFSAYPMCSEYVTTTEEDNEIDLFQLRKCESFKKIVLSCLPIGCRVGIPVPIGYDDVLDIESWPILQAFALDSVVCPTGFFTARYTVVDISTQLEIIFRSVDSHSVRRAFKRSNCQDSIIVILNTSHILSTSLNRFSYLAEVCACILNRC